MVLRDLLVYAQAHNARIMHYSDDGGVEADAVYQMADGRYALIEIKTGVGAVPAASDTLHPRALYREPEELIVICANAAMAYTTAKGIKVIPVGCLKD